MPKAQLAIKNVGHSSTQLGVWGHCKPPPPPPQQVQGRDLVGVKGTKPRRLSESVVLWYQKMARTPLSFRIFPVCTKVQTKMKKSVLTDWKHTCR